MRTIRFLSLVLLLTFGFSLAYAQTPQGWADYYGVTKRRAQIDFVDMPYLAFIPDFGDTTLTAIRNALPIDSEQKLRQALSTVQRSGKKIDMLLALYNFGGSSPTQPPSDPLFTDPALVFNIIDGDTFDVRYASGKVERVRPAGMDTPEVSPPECFFQQATDYARAILLNQWVWLSPAPDGPRDVFGRLLARVHLSSDRTAEFNKIMISQGYAEADERFPVGIELQPLEDEAKAAKRGMWEACN